MFKTTEIKCQCLRKPEKRAWNQSSFKENKSLRFVSQLEASVICMAINWKPASASTVPSFSVLDAWLIKLIKVIWEETSRLSKSRWKTSFSIWIGNSKSWLSSSPLDQCKSSSTVLMTRNQLSLRINQSKGFQRIRELSIPELNNKARVNWLAPKYNSKRNSRLT